jgi:hypothetical protein
MMQTRPEEPPASVLTTARQVAVDTTTLLRTEAELARLETGANFRAAVSIAGRLGVGLLLVLALLFALFAGLVALAQAIGWIAALLTLSGATLVIALLLLGAARRGADRVTLLPERTLARVGGDLRAMADAIAPNRTQHEKETVDDPNDRA